METIITNHTFYLNQSLDALRKVLDPEIQLNVVDLGLIYQVDFDESLKKIFCSMTLTTQFCPMGASITGAVENALLNAFPGWSVEIQLLFDPPWSQERISSQGKKFLNQ